jgi:hypothetical protein
MNSSSNVNKENINASAALPVRFSGDACRKTGEMSMRFTKFFVLAFLAFIFYSGAALAASEQTTTESSTGPATPGGAPSTGKKITPPVQPRASMTLDCGGGKKFKISTGSFGGQCGSNATSATCTDSSGRTVAKATCPDGCQVTFGAGTCDLAVN